MPPTFTAWRTSAASNQPQRRRRPVTVPNFVAAIAQQLAGRVRAARSGTGRSRPASHRPWRCPARSRPPPAPCRRRTRRSPRPCWTGDERIGAVIDVQHHRLGALEQDALAARGAASSSRSHTGSANGRMRGASSSSPSSSACLAKLGAPRPASSVLWCSSSSSSFVASVSGSARSQRGWRGAPPCPHTPGRCRARWCRSCARPAPPRARGPARRCSGRISAALSAMRSVLRRDPQPLRRDPVDLGQQRLGVDHHAVADDAELAAHQARGQQRQLVGLVADHQRMAGVVAALEAHHDVGAAGEPVHHLALALVAPLGADHGDIGHPVLRGSVCRGQRHGLAVPQRWVQPRRRASAAGSATASSAATVA